MASVQPKSVITGAQSPPRDLYKSLGGDCGYGPASAIILSFRTPSQLLR